MAEKKAEKKAEKEEPKGPEPWNITRNGSVVTITIGKAKLVASAAEVVGKLGLRVDKKQYTDEPIAF